MEADPQDLPPLAEVLAQVFDEGRRSERETRTFRGRCDDRAYVTTLAAPYDAERQRLRAENERLRAENERILDALRAIDIYGSDTLSGRVDGPDDRDWHRESVREMRNRARRALAGYRWDHKELAKEQDAPRG